MDSHLIAMLTIPLFTGVIGYVTNWTGIWMLFYPVHFKGWRIPGLAALAALLPRKIQQVPGIMQGGIGWQGIIPSRAAKMGSIAVDKGIAKLGTPSEFYKRLDPEAIAEHILASSRQDIREVVERIMEREDPQLWNDLPPQVREGVHQRVQAQMPQIVTDMTEDIGANIDHLMDVKLMVIRHLEAHPALMNRIFLEMGQKELRFIINFGFFFGLLQGIPLVAVTELIPQWWVLPIGGVFIGYFTNWVALWMIFEPTEPRKVGPFKLQGLFIRRQPEVADVYAKIIADDVVTLSHMGDELMHGRKSDRTRKLIENRLRPSIDRALGPARSLVRVAVGAREYDAIREGVATEGAEYAITPMKDEEFGRQQSEQVRELIGSRMQEMPPDDFADMLRSAMREDEWLLLLHGAVLGFGAGLVHLAIFGV